MNPSRIEKTASEWKQVSDMFFALGDETRQRMLLLFDPGEELTVKQLSSCFTLSQTACSHHIRTLRNAGALVASRRGKETWLSVDRAAIEQALLATIEHLRAPGSDPESHTTVSNGDEQ